MSDLSPRASIINSERAADEAPLVDVVWRGQGGEGGELVDVAWNTNDRHQWDSTGQAEELRTNPLNSTPPLVLSRVNSSRSESRASPSPRVSPRKATRQPYMAGRGSGHHYKQKYYSRLMAANNNQDLGLIVPAALIPAAYQLPEGFFVQPSGASGKQSSLRTICSLVNIMMGSTLYTMPWGFQESGLLGGVLTILLMGVTTCFTCGLVLQDGSKFSNFLDMNKYYGGSGLQFLVLVMSLVVLLGALTSYHILLSTVVYGMGNQIANPDATQYAFWNMNRVPVYVAIVLVSVSSARQIGIFVKANSLALVFTTASILFIVYISWFADRDLSHMPTLDEINIGSVKYAGVLSMGFFLHNTIVTIMKNHEEPEHALRDMRIAWFIVSLLYLIVGASAYLTFYPQNIAQCFLDMFAADDLIATIPRACLLFQIGSVAPLILFVLRTQFFGYFWNDAYPSTGHVVTFNIVIMTLATFIIIVYPNMGDIQRFAGTLSGSAIVFLTPLFTNYVKDFHHYLWWIPSSEFRRSLESLSEPLLENDSLVEAGTQLSQCPSLSKFGDSPSALQRRVPVGVLTSGCSASSIGSEDGTAYKFGRAGGSGNAAGGSIFGGVDENIKAMGKPSIRRFVATSCVYLCIAGGAVGLAVMQFLM
jgi:sodium-coupled neutral amino acid transporter 9